MTAREYRQIRKSMSLTCENLAYLLGYAHHTSISNIELGRYNNENGELPVRTALAIIAIKYRYDDGILDTRLGDKKEQIK